MEVAADRDMEAIKDEWPASLKFKVLKEVSCNACGACRRRSIVACSVCRGAYVQLEHAALLITERETCRLLGMLLKSMAARSMTPQSILLIGSAEGDEKGLAGGSAGRGHLGGSESLAGAH